MPNDLSFYQAIASEEIKDDDNRKKRRDWTKIDKMYNGDWMAPKELSELSWWKTVKTTAPHDALDAPTRVLSNLMPKIDIIPNNASEQEAERVERIEEALLWHFEKANSRSVHQPLRKIVHHALRYAACAFQIQYLPYQTKGMKSNARMKAIKASSEFVIKIHNPQTVYPRYSDFGLESVLVASVRTVYDVIKEYGKENPGVKKLLAEMKDDTDYRSKSVAFFDYTDWEDRVIWIAFSEGLAGEALLHSNEGYEIMREEHKLPFLPWVVREDEHPLLKPIVDNNLYEITNILLSLRYGQVVGLAAAPKTKSVTASGDGVEIDYNDPAGQAKLKPGEQLDSMPPPRLDPELTNVASLAERYIAQATSSKILGSLEDVAGASTPFSTINAMIQTALSQLGRYTNLAETAVADGLYLMLRWVEYNGDSLLARVSRGRNANVARGAQIMLKPASQLDDTFEDNGIVTPFDPDNLNIRVNLRSDSSNDQQSRMNLAILAKERFNMSPQDAADMFDLEYTQIHQDRWTKWQFEQAEVEGNVVDIQSEYNLRVQAQQQELQMQMQMAMQAQQMQMQQIQQQQQMQMQQQAQMQQPNPMNDIMGQRAQIPVTQGVDNRMAPQSPTPSQFTTREEVSGMTQAGDEVAL